MALLKISFVALALAAVCVAEPPPPGPQNAYLPPTNNNNGGNSGYNYNRPSPTFTAPRPTPAYSPPQNSYTPPPSFSAPKPAPSYGPPTGGNAPYPASVRPPQGGGGHDHDHHEPGMPYDFNYAVKDDYYGTDFSHNAASDGDVVRGEYRVLLPDGRTQIVRYTADWKNGYNAEVTYEGTASYPAPSNNNNVNQQYGPPKTGY